MLVDSHCHLNRLNLKDSDSLDNAVQRARDAGVEHMLCVAVALNEFVEMKAAVAPYPGVSLSCGVHPLDLDGALDVDLLQQLAVGPDVVAIGETGLDYHYDQECIPQQQLAFRQQIQVANSLNKPIIVHTREAREDTMNILREEHAEKCGGVLHCFTENWEMAEQALELGFYISFSGIVTFRNAEALRDVAKRVPLERMLIETDSPYLAPVPYRGKPNEPAYVREVGEYVAHLRGMTLPELAQITKDNFFTLFSGAAAHTIV